MDLLTPGLHREEEVQVETQRLSYELGQTQQHEGVAFHILLESGPLFDVFVGIPKKDVLVLCQISLQQQLNHSGHIAVIEGWR